MGRFKDLSGQVFNDWKIIRFDYLDKNHASHWICECQKCHKTMKSMSLQVIKKSIDCGCSKLVDLTNKKIGYLTVLRKVEDTTYLKFPRKTWECECRCGALIKVPETKLLNNKNPYLSCGCANQYKGYERPNLNEIREKEDYLEIVLNDDTITLIDKEDIELVKHDRWCVSSDGYAISASGKYHKKRLHRVIMGEINTSNVIDHINRNRMDNRKNNLRVVTNQENSFNQTIRKNNTSGIIGVSWWSRDNNWMAQIKHNYKRHFLGYYEDINDAIRARLQAEIKYFGAEYAPQRHLFKQYGIEEAIKCIEN